MAIDFALNENGDILFTESTRKSSSLQLDFLISNTNALKFDFYITDTKEQDYLPNMEPDFIFNFYINNIENNKEIFLTESDEDLLFQKIKLRLNTILGTVINNEELGSDLINYKHIILNPEKENFSKLIETVKKALDDILPNAEITVKRLNTNYIDYSNSLLITIVKDEINYYYYL